MNSPSEENTESWGMSAEEIPLYALDRKFNNQSSSFKAINLNEL